LVGINYSLAAVVSEYGVEAGSGGCAAVLWILREEDNALWFVAAIRL